MHVCEKFWKRKFLFYHALKGNSLPSDLGEWVHSTIKKKIDLHIILSRACSSVSEDIGLLTVITGRGESE